MIRAAEGSKSISKFNWFIVAMTIIKIVMMGLFSSDYQNSLFLPFVNDYITNFGNPYQRAYEAGVMNAFPYPAGMLFVEAIGGLLIKVFSVRAIFWTNFLFKLPSFIADLVGLIVLIKFFPDKRRYVAVLYYASPIVIYGVYMHSQLDLIPMVFLVCALYFLVSKKSIGTRYVVGSIFTIVSLLCKLHILAVIPIIVLYLIKRDGILSGIKYGITITLGTALGLLMFWSPGFSRLVLFNGEQSVLTKVYFDFYSVYLYIPIAAVVIVYILAFKISYMNRELFLNFCGIVFSTFLAFCPPMPGWYVWIVPFMVLFFSSTNEEKYKNIMIYAALNILYCAYFVFFHNREYVDLYFLNQSMAGLKVDNEMLSNISFTLLSAVLIYLVVSMYRLGIASNNYYKRKNIPFTIGIAGDSGAGKSTFLKLLKNGLGASNFIYMEGDGDHRWERGDTNWDDYTALNPKANYIYRQAENLKELRSGSAIRRSDYDHETGTFTKATRYGTKKYVVLCGLHALYLPQTRKNLDLKIYMDSDEKLRRFWKIQRDTTERGYSKEKVLSSIEERLEDAKKYVYPQRGYADLIIRYFDRALDNEVKENYNPNIGIELTMSAAVDIEPLISSLLKSGIDVKYEYSDDLKNQYVLIEAIEKGKIIQVEEIADRIVPQLEEITRENLSMLDNTLDGVLTLFVLLIISNKMQGV